MPTYGRKDVVFERGEGNYLYATDGRRYLDFTSGIAVNALGHCHPYLVKALAEQGQKLWNTSNLFRVGNGEKLAQRLVENSFADTMFFCNSGAEAIEGGIKLIRKYQFMNGKPGRYKIICFQAAFHGRLLNALAATGNEKYLEGFGPPAPGYKHAPLNNTNVVRDMIDDETAGILVEPIQGEGGIRATTTQFLKDLRAICDEFGLLLFYDEIHTGFGRTGKLWGYDWSGVKPDVAAIAKGMGGGFPIGAFMATEKAAVGMVPGTHGSTYGGNPLATGVANAVLDELLKPGFIDSVREKGEYLKGQLEGLVKKHPKVYIEQRGMGFLQGIQCTPAVPAGDMVNRLQSLGMLVPPAGENVIRVFPALIADKAAIDEGIDILSKAAQSFEPAKAAEEAMAVPNHFLDLDQVDPKTLREILDHGKAMKKARSNGGHDKPLGGKTLAMIFEKPSTRTRVSFEVGMRELGGQTIMLGRTDTQLGRGETIADTARVLSRYVDIIMMRTTVEEKLLEMAKYATVPVINGLTDKTHPCQLMADVMTYEEHRGPIRGRAIAWSGDGNNMATSWIHAAVQFDFELRVACPPELKPPSDVLGWAQKSKGRITIGHDPEAMVRDADCVVTDTWVSMGDEDPQSSSAARRHNLLRGYQVDQRLMKQAKADAIFMHCLPAHRGEEVTGEVIDGPQSVVFDEAETRLHAQKSILAWCLS